MEHVRMMHDTGLEERLKQIRENLITILNDANSLQMPIIILNFSVYNEIMKPLDEHLLLAEVGMSVFTIGAGIFDNFSALIDPGLF